MIEGIRRIILAVALFTGIWLLAYTVPQAITVHEPDFERRFKQKARWSESLTFDQFLMDETTAAQTLALPGSDWSQFRARVQALFNQGQPDPELKQHAARGHFNTLLYYAIDDPVMAPVREVLSPRNPHVYLAFDGDGPSRFLSATLHEAGDLQDAPGAIVHPHQRLGWMIILLGLALYIAIPWKRPGGDAYRYNRLQGAILPDVVGVLLGAVFFALPLFVCTRDSIMARIMVEHGYFGITLVALLFSTGGLVTWVVSAWFAAYEILILPDRLRFGLLTRTQDFPFEEITAIEPIIVEPPRWMVWTRRILFLVGQWRTAAQMTAGVQSHPALIIHARSGTSRRFSLTGFSGAERLLLVLRDQGVPVSAEALEFVFGDDYVPATAPPAPPQKSARGPQTVALVVLALVAAVAFYAAGRSEARFAESAIPVREPAPSLEAVLRRGTILKQMDATNEELRAATDKVKNTSGEERKAALQEWTTAKERFDDLAKQFEAADDRNAPDNTTSAGNADTTTP